MTITIGQAVTLATGHLGRLHLRATLRRQLAIVLGAVAVGGAVRPFLWPLHAQASWHAVLRTAILGGAGGLVALTVLVLRAWRSRPTPLASARRVDAALALEDVVASGYAFERDARGGEIVMLARQRALAALHGVDVRRLLRPAGTERTRLGRNMVRLAVAGLFVALIFGGVDRLVLARFLRPVTRDERAAAAELRKAADALEKEADPTDKQLVAAEAARKAAAATERGDRQAAMDALDEMRKAERAAEASEREQARELRALKDALDGKGASDGAGDRSSSAADALATLGKKDPAEMRKLAERLAKAEAAAKAAAKAASESGKGASSSSSSRSTASAWERAASALAEARAAAERGDSAGAKAAMERAAKEIEALEKSHGSASMQSLAKASASASSLDRSLQAGATAPKGQAAGNAMAGDGKDGSSGAKPGNKPGDGARGPGGGGGPGDRAPGQVAPERPKVEGDLQARADVKEGEKAAGVIDGMGKGGDPKDYRALFPAYDTAVEDGLREELVPAARRPAVRRYFESIRPNDPGDKP